MKLRYISAAAVLLGTALAIGCGARNSSKSPIGRPQARAAQSDEIDERNLKPRYAGWTFGRFMGVSLNPNYIPPPPGF